MLDGARILFVGLAAVFYEGLQREANVAGRRQDSGAAITVEIGEIGERNVRLDLDLFFATQIGLTRRMDVQHQDNRRGRRELELNVETDFDDHAKRGRGMKRAEDTSVREIRNRILWARPDVSVFPRADVARTPDYRTLILTVSLREKELPLPLGEGRVRVHRESRSSG